jgi:disulfide bond formation protein DsbB
MMQRVMVIAIGLIALVAALHDPKSLGLKIYSSMTLVFALGGMALSGRQLWLQSLPADRVPACGPGIDYMLDVFPILKVIEMSIRGTGDCAEVQWTFLGVSIPGWTLLVFIIIAGLSIWQWRKSRAAVIH